MKKGLTLLELLAAMAILALLSTLALHGAGKIRNRKDDLECMAKLRALSQSTLLYAADNLGQFPRSGHSGNSWAAAVALYLNEPASDNPLDYRASQSFICPVAASATERGTTGWSYGLNVFFELSAQMRYTPAGLPILGSSDNYKGSPATWHRLGDIPQPARTILLAENPHPVADHFMAHQWSSASTARNAVASTRHGGKSNFAFVDGRVEMLDVVNTFSPETGVNLWNPSLAHP